MLPCSFLFNFHVGLDDLSVLHGRCSVPKALQAGFEPCLQYLEHFEHTYHLRSLKYPWSCSTADYSWLLMGLRLVLGITCPNFGLGCGLDAECWQVFVPVCNSLLHDWPDSKLVPSETMQYLDASTHGTHWMKCMLILRMQELDEIIEIYRNQAITLNHLEEGLLRNHLGPDLKVRLWKTVRASNVRCWMPLTRCNCIENAFQLKLRSGM